MRRTPGAVVECDRGAQRGASIADKGHFRDKWDIFAVQNREPEFARGHIGEGRVEVYPHFSPTCKFFPLAIHEGLNFEGAHAVAVEIAADDVIERFLAPIIQFDPTLRIGRQKLPIRVEIGINDVLGLVTRFLAGGFGFHVLIHRLTRGQRGDFFRW